MKKLLSALNGFLSGGLTGRASSQIVEDIASGVHEVLPGAGTVIAFDKLRTYGIGSAETGNFTFDFNNFTPGITQLVIHTSGSTPTFPSAAVKIGGTYSTSATNYIFLHAVSTSLVLVTINQAV